MRFRFHIRKARHVPPPLRDVFERYGETVVALVLAGGFQPAAPELQNLDEESKRHARDWLTEQGDKHHRHQQFLAVIEFLILLFVFASVVIELYRLATRT